MPRPPSPEAATIVGGLGDPSPYLLLQERVVVAVRRHVMVLVPAALETIGFVLGALMIQLLFGYLPVVRTVTLVIALAAVLRFCYLILEWRLERFVITDQRMMLVGGVLTRQVAVMPMRKVTDLTFEKPLVGQIFGYGTFIVESAGQDQALSRIEYLPRANRLYLKVSDLLFGDAKTGVDNDLVVDAGLRGERRTHTEPDPRPAYEAPAGEILSSRYEPDDLGEDLAPTDPQLGHKLAEVDFDAAPDAYWAAQLGGFPPDRSDGSDSSVPPSLFAAVQESDAAGRRKRARFGGLNGRVRRRNDREDRAPGTDPIRRSRH